MKMAFPLLLSIVSGFGPIMPPANRKRRGSSGVRMGTHNHKAALKRHRMNKIARASRKRNRR